MPTIQQLPVATNVNSSDEMPVSQAGLTRAVTVGDLLAGTQPLLTTPTNTVLGRKSSGSGQPETISLGAGLALTGGTLAANGGDHSGFPVHSTMGTSDELVMNAGGAPALLPVTALRALYRAGSNVTIDQNGVISASVTGSPSGQQFGSMATQQASAVNITGGMIAGADISSAMATAQGGTVARNLARHFADAVNINDFGLARDGVTDDSARVATAVAAATAKNGRLYVPAGGPILMGGAAQIALQGVSIIGDGMSDNGFPYGHIGSQFWISDTSRSPFTLGKNVTIEGVTFYYPKQFDQPNAPVAYPPLFTATPTTDVVAQVSFLNIQVTNAYDFLTIPQTIGAGSIFIMHSRICAINTCMTLPNVGDVIYLVGNLFSLGVFQDEYLHYYGGGSHAQITHQLSVATGAPSGATQIVVADATGIQTGWPVQGPSIPYNATVQAVSGNTITLSAATTGSIASGSSLSAIENHYYLRSYTAENGTWLLVTGNGTPAAASSIVHGGIIATNNYIFGYRYGVHVSGGNMDIARFSNCGFDQVGTILQVDNNGVTGNVQFDNFIAFGLLGDGSAATPSMFVISNPPPNRSGDPSTMLSVSGMVIGFCVGTVFDVQGQNVSELKIADCKLTRFGNTGTPGTYLALHINAPNARLSVGLNDVSAGGNGGSGFRIDAIQAASIVGNHFSGLKSAVDVETTAGVVSLAGNVSTGTAGGSAVIGIGSANVLDLGNSWDKSGFSYNPIRTGYVAGASNGLVARGDNGGGAWIATEGTGSNIALNFASTGAGGIGLFTHGNLPQFSVNDNPSAVSALSVSGASAGSAAAITSAGSQNNGVWLYGSGTGATQLGSVGSSGSPVVFKGAFADKSYSQSAPANGTTVVVPENCSLLQLVPAGQLSSLTVQMPAAPIDGQIVCIATTQAISAITIQASVGQALLGSPANLGANAAVRFQLQNGTWYAIG